MSQYAEREIASQEVTLRLPAEAMRQIKGMDTYQERSRNPDPLGNRTLLERKLASLCVRKLAAEIGHSDGFSVEGDGSIVEGDS